MGRTLKKPFILELDPGRDSVPMSDDGMWRRVDRGKFDKLSRCSSFSSTGQIVDVDLLGFINPRPCLFSLMLSPAELSATD